MSFKSTNLRVIGACHGFALWHYGTSDSLKEVLSDNYFSEAIGLLHQGHQIHLTTGWEHAEDNTWTIADGGLLQVVRAAPNNVQVRPIGLTQHLRASTEVPS